MAKENNKNRQYTKEEKDSVLKRLEQKETVRFLSEELDIPKTTIYQWVRTNNKKPNNNIINLKSKINWTSEDKFQIVIETAALTEIELAEYCRRKGIYLEEIKAWRKQCIDANRATNEDPKQLKQDLKEEQLKTIDLRRELRRKEKALAETAALLVLRKKAQAIWGDQTED